MKKECKYNFGEKEFESINGIDCPVWQTPKYKEAKSKVIETLESDKYKNVLSESDFWILINTYSNKTKVMYSGLIISHNGCLKINDTLENKIKPNNFKVITNGYNDSLVIQYIDDEICEFGEVSKDNCKNDYPYAMAYKRCFDRVVLKKSKLAYAGIYSDSEAEEFKEKTSNISVGKDEKRLKLLAEFNRLVLDTDTQKELIYDTYKVENNTQMSDAQLEQAIRKMKSKLPNIEKKEVEIF